MIKNTTNNRSKTTTKINNEKIYQKTLSRSKDSRAPIVRFATSNFLHIVLQHLKFNSLHSDVCIMCTLHGNFIGEASEHVPTDSRDDSITRPL